MALPPNDPTSIKPRRKYPRRNFLDADEVAANKRGEITLAQHTALKHELVQQGLTAAAFAALGAGVPLYLVVAGLSTPYGGSWQDAIWLMLFGGAMLLGLPGIVRGVRLFRSLTTARQEMTANEIDQTDGEVRWTGDIYAAFVDQQRLKPIYPRLGLRPGHYHFFHLRQSHWLLSAEKMAIHDDFDSVTEMQHVLAVTNRFSLEDLEANRQGYMTTRQRLRLWLPVNLLSVAPTLIVIGLFACAIWPWLLLVPGIVAGWFLLRRAADMTSGQVPSIDGVGQRQKPQRRGDMHKYLFGNLRFAVSGQAYNALITGQRYRVYYARYSKDLLSIEPLADER